MGQAHPDHEKHDFLSLYEEWTVLIDCDLDDLPQGDLHEHQRRSDAIEARLAALETRLLGWSPTNPAQIIGQIEIIMSRDDWRTRDAQGSLVAIQCYLATEALREVILQHHDAIPASALIAAAAEADVLRSSGAG